MSKLRKVEISLLEQKTKITGLFKNIWTPFDTLKNFDVNLLLIIDSFLQYHEKIWLHFNHWFVAFGMADNYKHALLDAARHGKVLGVAAIVEHDSFTFEQIDMNRALQIAFVYEHPKTIAYLISKGAHHHSLITKLQSAWRVSTKACGQILEQELQKELPIFISEIKKLSFNIENDVTRRRKITLETMLSETLTKGKCRALAFELKTTGVCVYRKYFQDDTMKWENYEEDFDEDIVSVTNNSFVWVLMARLSDVEFSRVLQQIRVAYNRWVEYTVREYVRDLSIHDKTCRFLKQNPDVFRIRQYYSTRNSEYVQHKILSSCPFVETQDTFIVNAFQTVCEKGKRHILQCVKMNCFYPRKWRFVIHSQYQNCQSLCVCTEDMRLVS